MSLQLVNTGTYTQLFDDLKTVLGTNLSWTLFDPVDADEEIYTIPPTTGGFSPIPNPSFLRIFRDNTAFSVTVTIYDDWNATTHVGTNPIPAADITSKNILDFTSAIATAAYRIYGNANEGFIAILHDGSGGLSAVTGFWIGVLQGRATPAAHPNPNAILYKTTISAKAACDFLNQGLSQINEIDAEFFFFGGWTNSTEQHSTKSPLVSAFAWLGQVGVSEISGIAKDFFQCSGNLGFGDTITIASAVHRVMRGGGYAVLE